MCLSLAPFIPLTYLFKSSVHGANFLLGELCRGHEVIELNRFFVSLRKPLGDSFLEVEPKLDRVGVCQIQDMLTIALIEIMFTVCVCT